MTTKKFYCYVDETGQDTKGKFFLVTVVVKDQQDVNNLQEQLEGIEKLTKKKLKWSKSSFKTREKYLLQIAKINKLKGSIFYSVYHDSKEYISLTSLTVAKSVLARGERNFAVNIIIDGLKKKEMEEVRKELKKLKINYRKIRGMKDEQDAILRLADSIAGFLRDCTEGQIYTKKILSKFKEAKIIIEV